MEMSKIQIKPFLKWAGGKRWFVNSYPELLPKKFNRYIEPFLGSGAVFFYLYPQQAILGDSNKDLIHTYEAIKNNWKKVVCLLEKHHNNHTKEYYYRIREYAPESIEEKAARIIYLNRTCWNGLYRVNKKGFFNVPIGTRDSVLRKDDHFDKISQRLAKTELIACDFEELIDQSEKGDFLYVDPPYTVRHNNNAFIKYNEKLFSWDDQKRLSKALERARRRGSIIVCTNAYHKSIIDLYKKKFNKLAISRTSCISSKVHSRNIYEEIVIYTKN